MDNSRILIIPDLHLPYAHCDSFDFLEKVKKIMQPSSIICLGDELDFHSYSFHSPDPDLDSAGKELSKAIAQISYLKEVFPEVAMCESNHGSMVYRKQKFNGTPRHLLKSYNEVLGVDDKWKWFPSITVVFKNGRKCKFVHQAGANILAASQSHGCSLVSGHLHSQFEVRYWDSGNGINFGAVAGCLIDNESLAFAYNKLFSKKPILGCMFIENGLPSLIPMTTDSNNRWSGTKI